MTCDWSVVNESDVSEVLCELGSQATSRFASVEETAERGRDLIDDICRSRDKRVSDMKGMVVGSCEDGDAGDVKASSASEAGGLGGRGSVTTELA